MPVESTIRSRVEAFASELVTLIRAEAVEMLESALGAGKTARMALPGRAPAARRAALHPKGQKRDPNVLAALVEKLAQFVSKNPGQRIEQISKALGVPTKDLVLPVKKLILEKRIKTKGQKRATTYFPGGTAAPAKKSSARKAPTRRRSAKTRTPKGTARRKAARRAKAPSSKPNEVRPAAVEATPGA